jgi:hypothetical protein
VRRLHLRRAVATVPQPLPSASTSVAALGTGSCRARTRLRALARHDRSPDLVQIPHSGREETPVVSEPLSLVNHPAFESCGH